MKNILVRGGMSPYDNKSIYDIMLYDLIGSNSGNILYLNAIYKLLQLDTNTLSVDSYKLERTTNKFDVIASEINEKYDCFVIPLADAFRENFIQKLVNLTEVIKRLKIPCIVIGSCLRADLNQNILESFPFDKEVKQFVSSVLDKSAEFGVRGELTRKYLSHLGFGNYVRTIGCPSMILSDNMFNVENKPFSKELKLSINVHRLMSQDFLRYYDRLICDFEDTYCVTQGIDDFRKIYIDIGDYKSWNLPKEHPIHPLNRLFKENRIRTFTSTSAWFNFLKTRDLSFGVCIHGTIAAIQAGIPAVIVVTDLRTKELAEYHNISHIYPSDISNNMSLFDLYEKFDFTSVLHGHEERVSNLIDFISVNGLEPATLVPDQNIYNKRMSEIETQNSTVEVFTGISKEELIDRLGLYFGHMKRKLKKAGC